MHLYELSRNYQLFYRESTVAILTIYIQQSDSKGYEEISLEIGGIEHMAGTGTDPDLPGQFILDTTINNIPERWISERIGDWFLGCHPTLPVIRLIDEKGQAAGWLLGYAIDEGGRLLQDKDTLRVNNLIDGGESCEEEFTYRFGGRFLTIFAGSRWPRVYLDPCGSLSAVYCPHCKIVASTTNLIPYDDLTNDRVDLARELGIPYTNAMYPLDLTPRYHIFRLLPNHYLDLSTWQSVRHWPSGPIQGTIDVEKAIGIISAIVRRNIAAVTKSIPTYLCLTGGQDSRMLLACAKDVANQIELLTFSLSDDDVTTIDIAIARQIGKKCRIRHSVLPPREPKPEDLKEWMNRIGFSTGEVRGWQGCTMFRQADPAYARLYGVAGGLGRAFWSREYAMTDTVSPERLLDYCRAPYTRETLEAARQWLDRIPFTNASPIMDLFMLEQRIGCWAGVWPYAYGDDPGFTLFPMCHREVITTMLSLPAGYRRSGNLMRDIIQHEWAELLEWPFSEPIGSLKITLPVRRLWKMAGKVFRNPGSIIEGIGNQ